MAAKTDRDAIGNGKKKRNLTRRAFIGLGCTAALAGLIPWEKAFAGVGTGGWGNSDGWASVGASFGYDGGWGYSYDGTVWLSVSANCTIPRMSELLCEITVTSYYANGGIWTPTWYTDYADTHVRSYIGREGAGWLSSAEGFYDTTYDDSNYHGPYVTDVHTIRREAGDYRAYCEVNAWCDSADNANGIDTYASVWQRIPHHTLNDDKSWRNKIFTITPRCSPNLRLDVGAGQVGNGSNIFFWEPTNTTNQCWCACGGVAGLTVLEPVHVNANMCLDSGDTAPWSEDTNVHLWSYVGGTNQVLWLHSKGDGYHYPVFHHSGMALDCAYAGTANGTKARHYNSYMRSGSSGNAACNYKLEEVIFRERSAGAMTVTGTPEAGQTLTPANPHDRCFPYNFSGTDGMLYKYTWHRGETDGAKTTVVQAESEASSYTVTAADEGSYLTCVVNAYTRFWGMKFKGEVQPPSILVPDPFVDIKYFADDSASPIFTEQARKGAAYHASALASAQAIKPNCAGLDGWYIDAGYRQKFADGSIVNGTLNLYARNKVTLEYETASNAYIRTEADKAFYMDSGLTTPLHEAELYPVKAESWYGKSVTFAASPDAYYRDLAEIRTVTRVPGVYALNPATGASMTSAKLMQNTVVYCNWKASPYDGVTIR